MSMGALARPHYSMGVRLPGRIILLPPGAVQLSPPFPGCTYTVFLELSKYLEDLAYVANGSEIVPTYPRRQHRS